MATRETAGDPLYPVLVEHIGQGPAMDLIDRLPPPGSEIATREDVRALGVRMDGLEQRMDGLEQRMEHFERRVERHMERFDDKMDRFHEGLRDQTRNLMLANTGMMLTLAAILVAAGLLS